MNDEVAFRPRSRIQRIWFFAFSFGLICACCSIAVQLPRVQAYDCWMIFVFSMLACNARRMRLYARDAAAFSVLIFILSLGLLVSGWASEGIVALPLGLSLLLSGISILRGAPVVQ